MLLHISDLSFASGVTIPAGAVLVVPVELVQKDELNWGSDASHFNPYRFLSTVTNRSGMSICHLTPSPFLFHPSNLAMSIREKKICPFGIENC